MEFRNVVEELRPARKTLVIAAEAAAPELARTKLLPTQLNHLVAICGDATCSEEIANYIRYQEARESWPSNTAEVVIARMTSALNDLQLSEDVLKVGAWRLYAVFLARAFKYQRAQIRNAGQQRGTEPRNNQGQRR